MRRLLTTLVSCTLATLTAAADAPVLAQITISDGPKLVRNFQASVLGRLWNDPALAPLRARLDEVMPVAEAEIGFAPFALLEALTAAQATMFGLPMQATPEQVAAFKKAPNFRAQVALGPLATKVFTKLATDNKPVVLPGVTEAVTLSGGLATLARIDEFLVISNNTGGLVPQPIAASPHDVFVTIDGRAIADSIRAVVPPTDKDAAHTEALLKSFHRLLVPMTASLDITPDHFITRYRANTTLPFLTPVDLSLCARLPATAYAVSAGGFDGGLLWDDLIAPVVTAAAATEGMTPEQLFKQVDQQLADLGATITLKDLIVSLRGTALFAQTPGAPFPGYTLAIPRSPALDQLLGIALKLIGNDMPEEGQAAPLAFPNVPLPVTLVRDRQHWVISTDTALATTWSSTADGGWLGSPLGKLAVEKAGTTALIMSVTDTAAELRSMQGYIGIVLGSLPMQPKEKQAVMRAFSSLIANAKLSHEIVQQRGDWLEAEGQSTFGGNATSLGVAGVMAGMLLPVIGLVRAMAAESAVATTLRTDIYAAQVQFQGGTYRDLDGDNVGEYGFFHELAGGSITGDKTDITLKLLPTEIWNKADPEVNGYRFAVYLPDGQGGAYGAEDELPEKIAAAGEAGEKHFVIYAWYTKPSRKHRVFALTELGEVYVSPTRDTGNEPPAWNDLFGGEDTGWMDAPVWKPHKR